MGALHQFDYIFGLGMAFAFLDAWNIGANDVANSFATSISSRALKYWQAMILAAIFEFSGAVFAGSRVTDTVRNKIIDVNLFKQAPAPLMLAMMCVLIGSSSWLTIATRMHIPVSTTHTVVGAIMGAAIATFGHTSVKWGMSGFAKIVSSWFIAPALAGVFSSLIYLLTKAIVLDHKKALRNGLWMGYLYMFSTFSVLAMLIFWKGAPNLKLDKLSTTTTVLSIISVGLFASLIYGFFFHPFYYRKLVKKDYTITYKDFFYGPFLYYQGEVPPLPEGKQFRDYLWDYYQFVRSKEEHLEYYGNLDDYDNDFTSDDASDEKNIANDKKCQLNKKSVQSNGNGYSALESIENSWKILIKSPKNWPKLAWNILSRSWSVDVVDARKHRNMLSGNTKLILSKAKKYDNSVEALYSFLQVITACTAAFAHGSNDIANAVGPLTTIYQVWSTNTIGSKSYVPIWILLYASVALVIGLWTYGHHIMRNLGNKITLQSPSRGFSIQFGAALTTIIATRLNLPVSTTQSIIGATVAIGLCNGTIKAVNWRIVSWCYFGWILTLPIAGLISGCLMAIIINAPKLGQVYELS